VGLDSFVLENRFTISVVFPVVGAVMLLASAEGLLPEILLYSPLLILLGTAVMRLPLIAGLTPIVDRKGLAGLGLLTFYTYIIEFIGVTTGFPYGEFQYGIQLGPMLFDKMPLALSIFFIPLVANAYMLILLLFPKRSQKTYLRLLSVISTVLLLDLVLDPAAVAINFWSYTEGIYYGVPLSNYFGWILSASVAVITLDISLDRQKLIERLENCNFILDDMVSFVFLWGVVNLYFLQIIPFLVSLLVGSALWKAERFDFILS